MSLMSPTAKPAAKAAKPAATSIAPAAAQPAATGTETTAATKAAAKAEAKAAKALQAAEAKAARLAFKTALAHAKETAVSAARSLKYLPDVPDNHYVARDIRGRILGYLTSKGEVRFDSPIRTGELHKVQYQTVFAKCGLFVTVHRNNRHEGERAMATLRRSWLSRDPAKWTRPQGDDWSGVLVVGRTDPADYSVPVLG